VFNLSVSCAVRWVLAAALVWLAAPATSTATIIVNAPSVPEGFVGAFPITISATNGETISGVDFFLAVNEGVGPAPMVLGLDLNGPGTIFGAAPSSVFSYDPLYDPPTLLAAAQVLLDTPGTNIPASGVLAYVSVDLQSYPTPDIFPASLISNALGASIFYNSQTGPIDAADVQFNTGYWMTGPEPSSFVLAGLAGAALAGVAVRRARKRG
jgi:hypothetical protein